MTRSCFELAWAAGAASAAAISTARMIVSRLMCFRGRRVSGCARGSMLALPEYVPNQRAVVELRSTPQREIPSRRVRWPRVRSPLMGVGFSIFLIAVGAILKFAVTATVAGIDIQVVGVILMVAGAVGLVITLALIIMNNQNQQPPAAGPGDPNAPY